MKISVGKSRKDRSWQVEEWTWADLCQRLEKPIKTRELMAEFKAMSKDARSEIKDIGGFVGGELEGGRRKGKAVKNRTLITLDADYAPAGMWQLATALHDFQMCCYSTHSHTAREPRLRFIIPLDRPVSVEEFVPISRMVAKDLGINAFDATSHEPSRLMYWPSVAADGEYFFAQQEGPVVCADDVLARYANWRDASTWPLSVNETAKQQRAAQQQGDPLVKKGPVGLFCRAYSVPAAMETFLPGVYEPTADAGRYTYRAGSTFGGAVLYDGGKFLYSHHATDPAGGQLVNAFDLVRLHLYGEQDEDTRATKVTSLPSYLAMMELVRQDGRCRELVALEGQASALVDFEDSADWRKRLTMDDRLGRLDSSIGNVVLILEHDQRLRGAIGYNEFAQRLCRVGDLPWAALDGRGDRENGAPWQDHDDAALRYYLEDVYKISSPKKIQDARDIVGKQHAFHPVRNYLEGLVWDGEPRVETLFADYIGARDTPYVREVTRVWMTAAVKRIFEPGCKFDEALTLAGKQGIGKSQLAARLGRRWFSDSLTTVQGKEAMEALQGNWIVELGELAAAKKAEVETIKMFLSKCEDRYRPAYGHNSVIYPRQCVFFATTNDAAFLRDRTGGRRFWIVEVDGPVQAELYERLTPEVVDQLWAEAVVLYRSGQPTYLTPETRAQATSLQEQYTEDNGLKGLIEEYLARPVPKDWPSWTTERRRDYLSGQDLASEELPEEELVVRSRVCAVEVAAEVFGLDYKRGALPTAQLKEINTVLAQLPGWRRQEQRAMCPPYGQQRVYVREAR